MASHLMPIHRTKRILRESLPPLIALVPLAVLSGLVLHAQERSLLGLPILLLVLPSFIDMVGDVATVLSARMTSLLHLGAVKPGLKSLGTIAKETGLVYAIGQLGFGSLASIAYFISYLLGWSVSEPWRLVIIVLTSAAIATAILMAVGLAVAFVAFERGWDPDNVVAPILSTIGDLVGVWCFVHVLLLFPI